MPKVHFVLENRTVDARVGHNLMRLASEHGIELRRGWRKLLPCGERGLCGACAVRIEGAEDATNPPWTWEELRFPDRRMRMACQCEVRGDLAVYSSG